MFRKILTTSQKAGKTCICRLILLLFTQRITLGLQFLTLDIFCTRHLFCSNAQCSRVGTARIIRIGLGFGRVVEFTFLRTAKRSKPHSCCYLVVFLVVHVHVGGLVVCLLSWAATKIAMKKLASLSYRDAYVHGLLPNMSASALGAWQLLPARNPSRIRISCPTIPKPSRRPTLRDYNGDPRTGSSIPTFTTYVYIFPEKLTYRPRSSRER